MPKPETQSKETKQITVFPLRMDPALRHDARVVAAMQDKSLTKLINDLLKSYVDQTKQPA